MGKMIEIIKYQGEVFTVMKVYKRNNTREQHLAGNIAKILSVILAVVFLCLIGTVVVLSGNGMKDAIGDEFSAMAKGTGLQVQNVLASAENSAVAVAQYIQNEFKKDETGISGKDSYISSIYNVPISQASYEAETYITQTVRQSVKTSKDIVGMAVLFEPYGFDDRISDYAFYISAQTVDQPITPYIPYAEFSTQEYYTAPLQSGTTHITAPYEDAGYLMVTYCYPIVSDGKIQGVITADINVGDFEKSVFKNDKYKSEYTTIIDSNGIVIYDTESLDNVGQKLTDFDIVKSS